MPFDRMTTRSLSSPKAVERNHVAPSCSYRCPPSRSRAIAWSTQPSSMRLPSVVQTSNRTPSVGERCLDARPDPIRRPAPGRPGAFVLGVVAGAAAPRRSSGQLAGELDDVLAVVAVLGDLAALADREDRRAEVLHLGARVVEVVLARDPLAAGLEHAREQVADEGAARVADV